MANQKNTGEALLTSPVSYRKWDSNPHTLIGQGILSPSCLPFHHFCSLSDGIVAKPSILCEDKINHYRSYCVNIIHNFNFIHKYFKKTAKSWQSKGIILH